MFMNFLCGLGLVKRLNFGKDPDHILDTKKKTTQQI